MKKLPILFTAAAITAAGLTHGAAAAPDISAALRDTAASETAQTVYTTDEHYNYRLSQAFTRSPDSFEAWINLPQYSVGGTIMGNYHNNLIGYPGSVNWEADAAGRIKIFWNNGAYDYTFKNAVLSDGSWHHIALVRDSALESFSYYVDGELNETVNIRLRDAVCNMPMNVGVDYKNWTAYKTPLDGTVKQITVYNGAISEERILSDMQNTEITDGDGCELLGNWYFGENWTEKTVPDTSGGGNDAKLATFEKYVPVEPDGEYDYTLVGLPDIQSMVAHRPDDLTNALNWIKNNASKQKIEFAVQVGDLSDLGTNEGFYRTAAEKMSILDGHVPYSFVQGNHDYDDNCTKSRSSVLFNRYFPYSKYSKQPHFGGAFEQDSMSNTYMLFDAGGVDYLVINLEFGPRMSVIRWAGRLCEAFPQRRVIINTHGYLDPDGSIMTENSRYSATSYAFSDYTEVTSAQQLYDGLVKRYPNIFMVLCGHNCSDDSVVRTDTGVNGNKITSVLIDPQCTRINGASWGEDPIMLMRFNETEKTVRFIFYSPKHGKCFNIQNQFTVSFE